MNVATFPFLAAICALVFCYQWSSSRLDRRLLLAAANVGFLVVNLPNWQSGVALALFIAGTYGILLIVRVRPVYQLAIVFIALVFVGFVYLKRYPSVEALLPSELKFSSVAVIGLSYMFFKFIDVLVHTWQGALAPCDFFSYANYQLAFFTLLAGPIQRYNDFQQAWEEMDCQPGDARETLMCWSRVLTGMLKISALAPLIGHLFLTGTLDSDSSDEVFRRFVGQFYAYPLLVFFNFSGYTDVVIGCGGLLGFKLPENFNRPFFARNMLEFWRRWHMTLTQWIRDFVFIPSYKIAAGRVPAWSKFFGYALLFLCMCLVGAWHGLSRSFLMFGALNGLGVVCAQAYTDLLRACLGRAGWQRYEQNPLIRAVAVVVTYHFVCLCFQFFPTHDRPDHFEQTCQALQTFASQLGAMVEDPAGYAFDANEASVPLAASLPLVMVVIALLWLLWRQDGLLVVSLRLRPCCAQSSALLCVMVFIKTVLVGSIFLTMPILEQLEPTVIYQRF